MRILGVLLAFCAAQAFAVSLSISQGSNGAFDVVVNGETWLKSDNVGVYVNGTWFDAAGGGLMAHNTSKWSGTDTVGPFTAYKTIWASHALFGPFSTTIRDYTESGINTVIFSQQFSSAEPHVGGGSADNSSTTYPTFSFPKSSSNLGFLTFYGNMACPGAHRECTITRSFDAANLSTTPSGLGGGGPVVLFDDNDSAQTALVVSPASTFFTAGSVFTSSRWELGLIGSLNGVPAGYSVDFVIHADQGVNRAVKSWGDTLRNVFGKTADPHVADPLNTALTFYTDNGAYYYYNTGEWPNAEAALTAVHENYIQKGLPLLAFQLDSWWYPKDGSSGGDGAVNWTALPSEFPSGLEGFFEQNKLPIIAHMRYWAPEVTYWTKNGGMYEFYCDNAVCIPLEPKFWVDILQNSTVWGMRTIEHDWLDFMIEHIDILRENATFGRQWMLDMDAGAREAGVNIQLCMAYPRHKLQSLELGQVHQTRSSDDYHPSNDQWSLGVSCMLDDALGLGCWKDPFWSTSQLQNGSKWGPSTQEIAPGLELAVSVLSQGGVGPADRIGFENVTRIMRSCRTDGTILHASVPATAIDATFSFRAFGANGPDGELWSSYTSISGYVWSHVLGAALDAPFSLSPSQVKGEIESQNLPLVAWEDIGEGEGVAIQSTWDDQHPIEFSIFNKTEFHLWHAAPIFPNGIAFLGDTRKVVPVSPQRYIDIIVNSNPSSLTITVTGAPNEKFPTSFLQGATIHTVQCSLPPSGRATLSFPAMTCI